VRSRPEIEESLSSIHMNWQNMSIEERNKLIQAEIDRDLGISITSTSSSSETDNKDDGGGWGIWDWGKDKLGFKDGGIISLRR
jgi:hypothetical protein